ncbi:xanthine dehydrogenase family protein subunit M [Nostocoides sp. F2B08]|uniref:FAD binding domain-containing protein n=1 Tax=Nostocoides sp. F2B08 TaxID=2653936 RepID=UPI0012639194|nr:xanthine dehydrogenase family protein subunit M [Tetrasphaera sp. F2B08]KAB7744838.1 xanthine dehydrogenase family protein subunit M [Tetrasphaera sp. F2B08]
MRPVAFDYVAPTTVEEVVQALSDGGEDATVISGGQSLLPVLRMRMADPSLLVDLRRVDSLREIRDDGDNLVIGARATHRQVSTDPLVRQHAGLIAKTAGSIGDPQIRYRGTIGGSLAHADPAGDMGAAVLALNGSLELTGPRGSRTVAGGDFFVDYFTTAREPGEVVTAVRIPKHDGWGSHYEKFTVVVQAWAVVAVAAAVRVEGGQVAEARIGLTNMGTTPLRAAAAEQALVGVAAADTDALRAAAATAGEGTNPPDDPSGTPEYRRHLAGVLAGRAVVKAVEAVA